MHNKDNSLFDFLNFILKATDQDIKDYNPPIFLINRWLSMANPAFANIVNLTTNKWCKFNRNFDIKSFYRLVLPKYTKKITYLKKENKEKDDDDTLHYASLMECSQREIKMLNNTLAELNINVK
jgi:hypothetical protein